MGFLRHCEHRVVGCYWPFKQSTPLMLKIELSRILYELNITLVNLITQVDQGTYSKYVRQVKESDKSNLMAAIEK